MFQFSMLLLYESIFSFNKFQTLFLQFSIYYTTLIRTKYIGFNRENCSGDIVAKLLPSSVKQIAEKLIRPLLSFRGQCRLVNEPSFLTEVLSVAQKTGECKYENEICISIILILLLKLISQVSCKTGISCIDFHYTVHR